MEMTHAEVISVMVGGFGTYGALQEALNSNPVIYSELTLVIFLCWLPFAVIAVAKRVRKG